MGWESLLEGNEVRPLPWFGGRKVCYQDRLLDLVGKLPQEHGWYNFTLRGRNATLNSPQAVDPDQGFEQGCKVVRGYLVGDRLISDSARVDPDPAKLIEQTIPVFLVEPGLDRFSRAVVAKMTTGYVYVRQEFPQGPEADVMAAYQDRLNTLDKIQGVTPALDLAFRWLSDQRIKAEEWEKERQRLREEADKKRLAADRLAEARKNMGTGAGRRALAGQDFNAAARAALALSGAELLDTRPSHNKGEMVVQYRFQARRLECVCDMTLHIVDAGVCLDDHRGTKGDTLFTLESLPGVIGEAIRRGKLVVWRHVAGDPGLDPHAVVDYEDDDRDEDDDW